MVKNSSPMATRARHKARDTLLDLGGTKAISVAVQEFQFVILALRKLDKDESQLFLSPNDFQPLEIDSRVYDLSGNSFFGRGRLTDPLPGIPNTPQWLLFESKPYEHQIPQQKETVKQNVRILALKLHQAQQDKGVLRLVGFRDEIDDKQGNFQLVFACVFERQYPPNLESFLKANAMPSLNLRINLCSQLATTVLQTQTLGSVHKNHPERQLLQAEKQHAMSNDAYSLGVCMIEILTWKRLLIATEPPTMSQDFIEAFRRLSLQPDVGEPYTKYPDQIKQTLWCICDELLPTVAGNKMARLAKDFLTYLDAEEGHDENEAQQYAPSRDKDRRRVAVHFVDTGLKTLRDFQRAI
ncbi:HET-s/LopB domain protein [Fusarium austroafricanum]|uniref:HET-s/LopB domain protein n=1 Tax=Fusarium austroafricanum TaxID=2364996 RepID=A0A8H4KNP1_9HYPO|nr:HET-s/LopB domain protein [Fusarium austroafricanum]